MGNHLKTLSRPESDCNAFLSQQKSPVPFFCGYAYGLNPPDFHAYFEAFLDGRWILADPTRLSPQSSFIRIAQGRDAADTSFATIFGNATLTEMQLVNQLATTGSQPPRYVKGPISNCPV
jgi:transglutaminase-like putative cysteine protease